MTNPHIRDLLLNKIRALVDGSKSYDEFFSDYSSYFWEDEVQEGLDEIDNDFFYRIYECSTYAGAEEDAGKWGLKTADDFILWTKRNTDEFIENREVWFKRVSQSRDMWV